MEGAGIRLEGEDGKSQHSYPSPCFGQCLVHPGSGCISSASSPALPGAMVPQHGPSSWFCLTLGW